MQFIPVLVLMVLFFVMMFGIGFILNMLMKTTWFPSYLFIIVILPIVVYSLWDQSSSLMSHLGSFQLVDYMTGIAGLAWCDNQWLDDPEVAFGWVQNVLDCWKEVTHATVIA